MPSPVLYLVPRTLARSQPLPRNWARRAGLAEKPPLPRTNPLQWISLNPSGFARPRRKPDRSHWSGCERPRFQTDRNSFAVDNVMPHLDQATAAVFGVDKAAAVMPAEASLFGFAAL